MSSNSSTATSVWPPFICRCGAAPCLVKLSMSEKNPGRHYYSCPRIVQCGNFISWCDEYVRALHHQGRLQMDTSERLNVTTHPTTGNDSSELARVQIDMRQLQLIVRFVVIVNVMYAVLLLILLNRL